MGGLSGWHSKTNGVEQRLFAMSTTTRDAGKGALLAIFLVTIIDMIGFGIIIPFLTYLVQDLAAEEGVVRVGLWVGLLMTAYSSAQFISSPFWGSLSDRIGRRRVLMIGLVGNTVFFTAFGLSNTLLFALSMRFFAGIFNGNIAVARAYIGDVSTPKQLATRMGLIGAAFGLGFTIGPFIGGEFSSPAERWDVFVGTIFETYPYLLPCLIASILSAGSLVLAYFKLPESIDLERAREEEHLSWGRQMAMIASNSVSMLRTATIGAMIWVSMLFMLGFTVMHSVFILYTEMDPANGGLGFSEQDNGLTQAVLIGPLTQKFGTRRLIPLSIILTGVGLVLIPYTQTNLVWLQMLLVLSCIAIGNGVFQPSSSTYLTRLARDTDYDLGAVMGAQESLSAFARILGPLSGGFAWELTVNGSYPWDYHTPFHLCGLLMVISGLLTLRLPVMPEPDEAE